MEAIFLDFGSSKMTLVDALKKEMRRKVVSEITKEMNPCP